MDTHGHEVNLREVVDASPLSLEVLDVSQQDDRLELAVVVVAGAQGHYETAQAYEGRVVIREYTHYDMV